MINSKHLHELEKEMLDFDEKKKKIKTNVLNEFQHYVVHYQL